jgi:hypothetical protein
MAGVLSLNSEDITNTRVREGLGANKRTGAFVGGTALLGTVIGAIAGGGNGAAIGAVAGAGAGAGAQVLTRGPAHPSGDDSRVPARPLGLSLTSSLSATHALCTHA